MFLETPTTKYVESRNGTVAYQEFGQGNLNLLYMPGTFNHLDFMWSTPGCARNSSGNWDDSRESLFSTASAWGFRID